MKFYLSAPITQADDESRVVAKEIYTKLLKHGSVLDEHVVRDDVLGWSDKQEKEGFNFYEFDTKKIEESNAVVALVTNPSTGIGYELAYALDRGKPVLALCKEGIHLTKMLTHNTNPLFKCSFYSSTSEIEKLVSSFVGKVKSMPKHGLFIVLEGLDGSGKGEITKRLAGYLFDRDKFTHVALTREPGKSDYSRQIRKVLLEEQDFSSKANMLTTLFVKDRQHHLSNLVMQAMAYGCIVLSDRYKHSTLAYQQTQGIPLDLLIKHHEGMLVPDLTLILDVPAEVAIERIAKDTGRAKEMFDQLLFQDRLRHNYLRLPNILHNEKIVVVDANKLKETVFEKVKSLVDKVIA